MEKEHFTLLDGQIVESRRRTGGRGLDVTSQLHAQHLPKPDEAIFNTIQRKMQQRFLAVVNFGHKEGTTPPTSGSSQRSSSDKIFPHKESPPAQPSLSEKKQHTARVRVKKTRWRPTEPSRARRTTGSLAPSSSPSPPALFTFCWQGDLEVFGSSLRSLGTIRRFTF